MKFKMIFSAALILSFTLFLSVVVASTVGVKKKRIKPHEYGNVVIDNYSMKKDMAPVVFKHWLHRAKFSCRVCHIDIGFAMKAGRTDITSDDVQNGMYCGTCHDGDETFGYTRAATNEPDRENCDRCHSLGKQIEFKNDFYEFKRKFRRERFGNGVDWLDAEQRQLITLNDYIEGVSFKRKKLDNPEEHQIFASETGMPDIIFSHEKHAVWNGCELCHPDIFGVKSGETVYTMQDIFNNKYCGACHGKVAFPNIDCQRCHTKSVY